MLSSDREEICITVTKLSFTEWRSWKACIQIIAEIADVAHLPNNNNNNNNNEHEVVFTDRNAMFSYLLLFTNGPIRLTVIAKNG